MAPVAVLGASGQVGAAVVAALQARGTPVRRVLRMRSPYPMPGDLSIESWTADGLNRAFAGCEAAFLMVPLIEQAPELGVISHRAAEAAGVQRVVRLSVLQALRRDGLQLGQIHGALDDDLHRRGLEAASLCPDSFMQNLLPMAVAVQAGQLPAATGDGRMAFVDVEDIAACAVAILCGDRPCAGHHDLTGPQSLSMADIAALFSSQLGLDVRVARQTIQALRQQFLGFGMPTFLVDVLCELTQWTLDGNAQQATDAVRQLTGREPRAMTDFLHRHRAAFVG